MEIIISNAAVNNGNRGCVALSLSSMYIIDKILNAKNIPHTFYLPQSGYDQKEEHMIRAGDVTLKFVSLMDITPLTVKHYIKNLTNGKNIKQQRKSIKKPILFWI